MQVFAGAFGALLTAFVTNHMIIDFSHRLLLLMVAFSC